MTREEERFFKSKEYAEALFKEDNTINITKCSYDFRMGAKWADDNPKLLQITQ